MNHKAVIILPEFYILVAASILLIPFSWLFSWILAALIHELFHIMMVYALATVAAYVISSRTCALFLEVEKKEEGMSEMIENVKVAFEPLESFFTNIYTALDGVNSLSQQITDSTKNILLGTEAATGEVAGSIEVFNTLADKITASEEKVRMLDFKGKPIVVNLWATWCGPCKVELPSFEELYQEYGDRVQFMMVNLTDGKQEKKEDVQGFISKRNYTFPVFFNISIISHFPL